MLQHIASMCARSAYSRSGAKFGLRTARRRPAIANAHPPALVRATALDVLDRASILSRDISGTAQHLENARVVCVGVGSLGSAVAIQLARSGVGTLPSSILTLWCQPIWGGTFWERIA
jgi:hypothetical protein